VIEILSFVCQINSALLSWLGEATPTKKHFISLLFPQTASNSIFGRFSSSLLFSLYQ
jgi:hypothetical protein